MSVKQRADLNYFPIKDSRTIFAAFSYASLTWTFVQDRYLISYLIRTRGFILSTFVLETISKPQLISLYSGWHVLLHYRSIYKTHPTKTKYIRNILVSQNQSCSLIEWAEAHTVDAQHSLLLLREIIALKCKTFTIKTVMNILKPLTTTLLPFSFPKYFGGPS